jgi:hypothetical protein
MTIITPITTYTAEINPYVEVDYAQEATDRATTQFQDKDVFNRYLQLMLAGKAELREALKEVMQMRNLDNAEGAQLDIIGEILGQPRQLFDSVIIRYFGFEGAAGASPYKSVSNTTRTFGPYKSATDRLLGTRELTDQEYRRLLRLKIIKNTSNANITAFSDGVKLLFGIDNIDYQEDVPPSLTEGSATITISIGRDYNDPEKAAFPGLDEISLANRFLNKPLGVALVFQDPITFHANFILQNYEQFVFGFDGLTTVTFQDMFTFARPYTADYYNSSGTLVTAAIDEPRFDHDQTTFDPIGLLIEGPDEILTHTFGLEVNDSQGTFRVVFVHNNTAATEVAMVIEGTDFKIIFFREDTNWKVRVESNTTDNYELLIPQYNTDRVVASISYTPNGVFFVIQDEDRFTTLNVQYGDTNIRGFDLRIGGEFTTNVGATYGHFNGTVEELVYLRPYIGTNTDAVVDGFQINTEDYNKILTESNNVILT